VLVVRSHGIPPQVIEEAKKRRIGILDTTCPFVKKAQLTAVEFMNESRQVVICGDLDHAEVRGINAHIDNKGIVVSDSKEIYKHNFALKVGVLCQTTQKLSLLKNTIKALLDYGVKDLSVKNTICLDSSIKRKEVESLAKSADIMVVIGGKSSSNTVKLAEISMKSGVTTYHIETAQELKKKWFDNINRIGIAAGASTAQFLIDEVVGKIKLY